MSRAPHLVEIFGDARAPDGSLVRENFERWFGASVVVDQEGRPLVAFHGTANDFASFDTGRGLGSWFSTDPEAAATYADVSARWRKDRGDKLVPVYLAVFKPAAGSDMDRASRQALREGVHHTARTARVRQILEERGFDGVVDGSMVIAFHASQIKSAVGNSGAFDPQSTDLTDAHAWDAPVRSERMRA